MYPNTIQKLAHHRDLDLPRIRPIPTGKSRTAKFRLMRDRSKSDIASQIATPPPKQKTRPMIRILVGMSSFSEQWNS
jgi:hypothetical protein